MNLFVHVNNLWHCVHSIYTVSSSHSKYSRRLNRSKVNLICLHTLTHQQTQTWPNKVYKRYKTVLTSPTMSFTENSRMYFIPDSPMSCQWEINPQVTLAQTLVILPVLSVEKWRNLVLVYLCSCLVDLGHSIQPEWWAMDGVDVVLDGLARPWCFIKFRIQFSWSHV